jgi:hypothetical protein
METYWGSGGISPRILDLGTRWRWIVSFTARPRYPQGKSPLPRTHWRKLQIQLEEPCFSNSPLKNSVPCYPLQTERTKIFGKSLQKLAREPNRPLGLRRGRLMMIKASIYCCLLLWWSSLTSFNQMIYLSSLRELPHGVSIYVFLLASLCATLITS